MVLASPLLSFGTRSTAFAAVAAFFLGMTVASANSANSREGREAVAQGAGAPIQDALPVELQAARITETLGAQVDIANLRFRDEQGNEVALSRYFAAKKPVILTLVYYECPNLCNFLLNGFTDSVKGLDWTIGDRFEVVTVSINPRETPALAAAKKESYLKEYGRPEAARGWHFLTGEESQVQALAKQVGFGYRYDPKEKQYAHSAGIFVLTPTGRLSRLHFGVMFQPKDLKLSLLEASDGKIGTVIDRIMLFCYRYDPVKKTYSVYLTKVMQAGGVGTLLIFGSYLGLFWSRQRRQENLTKKTGLGG